MTDPAERFTDRVDTYVRARPGYPAEVVAVLRERAGLRAGAVVADVGAGTGIFTRLLADAGAQVHAVEPNEAMLAALVGSIGPSGTAAGSVQTHRRPAEATGLDDGSVDLVTAAQAFHWFDRDAVGREFRRILRPGGAVALVWNERTAVTPFLVGYDALLQRWATDYAAVDHRQITPEVISAFFAPGTVERHSFDSRQVLDRAGIGDRLLSSSYSPGSGHPDHEPMLAELGALFDAHAEDGVVPFVYRTDLYLGRFG